MYSEYFKKKNDRRRKRKTRLESPTIRTMRDGIAERSEGNDSAIELVEQLEVFADGTLDIFAREQSISEENRFTVYGFSELGKRMRAMAMLVMIESYGERSTVFMHWKRCGVRCVSVAVSVPV